MNNKLLWSFGDYPNTYVKLLYTPNDIGVGAKLYWNADEFGVEWEFSILLGVFQVWIGGDL